MWQKLQDGLRGTATTIQESFAFLSIAGRDATKALFWKGGEMLSIGTLPTSSTSSFQSLGEKVSCAVCWAGPDNPWASSCGHVYCLSCLQDQCLLGSLSIQFPIKCLGEKGQCSHTFKIEELEKGLPSTVFENLLRSSLDVFLRKIPEKFQFCSTVDCSQIYRVSTESAIITCSGAKSNSAPAVGSSSHKGLTCLEHQEWAAAGIHDFRK